MGSSPVGISVPLAICLGLLASFIQSLGLTIQRKAHLQNEQIPLIKRKSIWKMPLFLIGFSIFISANIGGTVFQIGALPLTILAPLGAVSLLFNALLARVLLNGLLSFYMVSGTVLITVGAVLIGYFGAIQETQHSLDELLSLYARPAFVAFATIAFLVFVGVLAIAHLAEWQLQTTLFRTSAPSLSPNLKKKKKRSQTLRRRWSAPSLAPVAELNESSSGIATPILDLVDEANRRGVPADRLIEAARQRGKEAQLKESKKRGVQSNSTVQAPTPKSTILPKRKDYGTLSSISPVKKGSNKSPASPSRANSRNQDPPSPLRRNSEPPTLNPKDSSSCSIEESVIRRTQLGLAVAYGAASGTLSGVCLLLAKSGVELLVLTFSGQNQFGRWQSWALVLIMLVAALLQLWYLNKSLKLADPTLVCPLAFCFYNTSSIALGLVYFNQLDTLAWYSVLLVVLGTAILLSGVWIVSLHGSSSAEEDEESEEETSMSTITPVSPVSSPKPISGIETSELPETAGLLANAGGIGGPHLPPLSTSEPEQLPQDPDRDPTSPTAPLSPKSERKRKGRSHSRTGSIRLFSGSGTASGNESPESPFTNEVDENQLPQYATMSPTVKESRMNLYTTLLERGLSIGISPSSPGFLLSGTNEGPSSPTTPRSASRRLSRRERQTFSESDAATTPSVENVLGLEAENEVEVEENGLPSSDSNSTIVTNHENHEGLENGFSRFNRIPGIDVAALSERLTRLRAGGGRGGGWFWSSRADSTDAPEERRNLLGQEEGNARPRETPPTWAGTRRR